MPDVKYVGNTRRGTMTPRRMWLPGETMKVDESTADDLAKDPNFRLMKETKTKKR